MGLQVQVFVRNYLAIKHYYYLIIKRVFFNVFYSAEYFQCTGTGGVSAESPDYKYSLLLSHNETCLFFPIQDGIISVPVNRDMSF